MDLLYFGSKGRGEGSEVEEGLFFGGLDGRDLGDDEVA